MTPRYVLKLPNTPEGLAALETIRKFVNREAGELRVLFNGHRSGSQRAYALRKDATAFRVYFNAHETIRLLKRAYAAERALEYVNGILREERTRSASIEEELAIARRDAMRFAQDTRRLRFELHLRRPYTIGGHLKAAISLAIDRVFNALGLLEY